MLFAFFGLWQATLGVGVGAIAIPVVIHLINKRRYKIMPWAAMRFLLAAQKQTRKRMRVEQLLLLLTRMAIIAMCLFAMAAVMDWAERDLWAHPWAKPVWRTIGIEQFGPGNNRTQRVHHIFVLDCSLSMNQAAEGNQSAFDVARQFALRKIQDNPAGDGYSVLLVKENPAWLVGGASQDKTKVSREIEAVKPTHGNSSQAAALNMVATKINEARSRFPAQAVYFFTDMQKTTWVAGTADVRPDVEGKEKQVYQEISDRATTFFIDVGPKKDAENLSVASVEFSDLVTYVTPGVDCPLVAVIENHGMERKASVRVELLIGKAKEKADDAVLQLRAVSQRLVSIDPKSRRAVEFDNLRFPSAGTYAVQVRIASDALEQDNTRTIIINVRETIPILLVNGKPSADPFLRASEYIRFALNPAKLGDEKSPLRPVVKTPSQFSEMTEKEIEPYDAVFFCDVDLNSVRNLAKIDGHVRRGGGFVVALGEKSAESLDLYNRLLFKEEHGLLPAKLMKTVVAPKGRHFYLNNTDPLAFSVPPLSAFADDRDKLTLRTARFAQFVQAVVPEGKANAILSFMPEAEAGEQVKQDEKLPINAPAIVEWNPPLPRKLQVDPNAPKDKAGQHARQQLRYRGKVILSTTALNTDWSNWPGSPSYLSMIHELTLLALSGRLREQSHNVGALLEATLPGTTEVPVTFRYPPQYENLKPKTDKTQIMDDVNIYRHSETDWSGVYRVEGPTGLEIPFAVNVPANSQDQKGSESDLSRVDETKLKELFPNWKFQIFRDPLGAIVTDGPLNPDALYVPVPVGPKLAHFALLLLLVLLFVEIGLAWKFGHYTTTDGTLSETPQGPTGTIIAAIIAIASTVLFLIGAVIVAHEYTTGDFLGILPDIIRNWFEEKVKGAALQPGEASSWLLEKQTWLFGLPREGWAAFLLSLAAIATIFVTYRAEAPRVTTHYKLLLGALRMYLILLTIWVLLPRPQIQFERRSWPDMVLLIDDTRSTGEADTYQDEAVIERVSKLSASIRKRLEADLPDKIKSYDDQVNARTAAAEKHPDIKSEIDALRQRQQYWIKQQDDLKANTWRPSRLQLVQAILEQPEPHWLKALVLEKKSKLHIFHLDANGRAIKLMDEEGDAGEITDAGKPHLIERASKALARLEPVGNESRLGVGVRQVIDHYRGSSLSSVIMFTDGVTTRDETLAQIAPYARDKGVSLWFVGVGDQQQRRDLKLHDLEVEDPIYVGDRAVFKIRLTGEGYKDSTVPIIMRVKDKSGKFIELDRKMVRIDPNGITKKETFTDQPKEKGTRRYQFEVEQPKLLPNEKPISPDKLRITRDIEVIDTKLIKVLYVEGQPRFEFRYLKYLLEREAPDEKQKKKAFELSVLLLDADVNWAGKDNNQGVDKTAITNFPPTLDELNKYDVLILGDCDPNHKKLQNRLKDVVHFVRGENEKGVKASKPGGGLLFMAGSGHNPHRYGKTPLADVMPIEPTRDNPPEDRTRVDRFRPELTPAGRVHPLIQFSPDAVDNVRTFNSLTPLFWHSTGYRIKPLASVLAVHPTENAEAKMPLQDLRHPLIVEHFPGTGRCMFFGFDETWRWRLRDDESKYNTFWIQTMRYLSRGRTSHTKLTLNQQTPYRVGDEIKITVTFPDSTPGANTGGPKIDDKTEVKLTVTYLPPHAKENDKDKKETEVHQLQLTKIPNSHGTYEGKWTRTREGKYIFRLTHPDVSGSQPDKEKPSATAVVLLPPGELDNLRLNYQDMIAASESTNGGFYTLANANKLLEEIPPGEGNPVSAQVPPTLIWNQWWMFVIFLGLITSEWILRKLKHLL
ncbi:MAG: VWA domain-containing protein [Gemmataceae bacterium]|nr:VWA domain-containing protein [Gemmataceae bacterium]